MAAYEKPVFTLEIPDEPEIDLATAYDQWQRERTRSLTEHSNLFSNDVVARQSDVALAARQLYDKSETLGACGTTMYGIVIEHLRVAGVLPEEGIDSKDTLKAAAASAPEYIGLPTPGEAMLTTIENFTVARKYATAMETHVEGIVMSGSNTWGSFFAVRSEYSKNKASDIDLVVEVADVDHMNTAVEALIASRLIAEPTPYTPFTQDERRRLQQFHSLYLEDAADIFSIRTHASGVEASIHFVLSSTMDTITAHSQAIRSVLIDNQDVTYLRDFRPNLPYNARENGYQIHDFRGFSDIKFKPTPTEVVDPMYRHLGYVSESPLGATIKTARGNSYGLGLIPFFLSISPVVLEEKEGTMQKRIATMQRSIGETMHGARPEALIREDRMPKFAGEAIKKTLTLEYAKHTKAAA
jgi:hypothetical protein